MVIEFGIWKVGVSAQGKRDPSGGKWALFFQAQFCVAVSPGRFLCPQGAIQHSLHSKQISYWSLWAPTGSQCPNISLVLMVLWMQRWFLWKLKRFGSLQDPRAAPLNKLSMMHSASSHPQTNELIVIFFSSGILLSPIKLLSQSSWNKSTILLHNSF